MQLDILHRYSRVVIYASATAQTIAEAIHEARANGANLGGANLEGAYLGDANLKGAYLGDAYLRGANLRGADLTGAKLKNVIGYKPD
jgi:uncharacterized protein YjbI with pentapeptide repeats